MVRRLLWLVLLGCGGESLPDAGSLDVPSDAAPPDAGVPLFHCGLSPSCPELPIAGAPVADYPMHPFHGIGDPSLERAPDGDLWLAYSYLETRVTPPDLVDFIVATHLARSTDGGRTFSYVRAANSNEAIVHWDDPMRRGVSQHEVSTLTFRGSEWELMWLAYFDALGDATMVRGDFFLQGVRAARPDALGDTPPTPRIRGFGTTASVGAPLLGGSGLENCAVLTEPALFTAATGSTYLAVSCLVFEGGARHRELDRLVLLEEAGSSYRLVGTLLDGDDARAFGADGLEQADISVGRDGTLLLLVTPLIDGADPHHQGCLALTIDDLATASVRRAPDGTPLLRARITADGNGLGPGLCTYDAASETGVLLVITTADLAVTPPNLTFSLRATGVHP